MADHHDGHSEHPRANLQENENMTTLKGTQSPISTVVIFFLAACFSLLVLNRWLFTDLGVLSYGRIWQLYISYTDFGFFRRGFVGTILSETKVNMLFSNEYYFAFFIHSIAILVFSILIAYYCIKEGLNDLLFVFGIAFSPALIIHSGYTTGALDVFVFILAVINILYMPNSRLFAVFLIIGVLIHELFLVTVPAQFWAYYVCQKSETEDFRNRKSYFSCAVLLITVFVVFYFGKIEISEPAFTEVMQEQLPNASEKHPLWSGFFELSSSVEENFDLTRGLLIAFMNGKIFFLAPLLLYVFFLILRAMQFVASTAEAVLVVGAIFAPILISLVAADLHRWFAMSASMALLITLRLVSREGSTMSLWNWPIALFCFLGPFGGAELERPFPLHQFWMERVLEL
ncbi:hypothetical protein AB2B41_11975 [Marimonas sp. MJW-29]|uniref:EpsG family protein n=1 Tax=Sulfitobacter sediminis TaxID=3234186 RepID=A0ABV3RP16_9RHOB